MNGHETRLYTRSEKTMNTALDQIKNDYKTLVSMDMYEEDKVPAALANLIPTHDLAEAVKDVDMVIEAVSEDPAIKKDMFSKLDALVGPDVVLSTNTSTLNIYEIVEVSHPEGQHLLDDALREVPGDEDAHPLAVVILREGDQRGKDLLAQEHGADDHQDPGRLGPGEVRAEIGRAHV